MAKSLFWKVDLDDAARYGTMVYERCGERV